MDAQSLNPGSPSPDERAAALPSAGISDVLAIGFGTTVAMWAVGYVGHMPLTQVPPVVFVSLMLGCLIAGGWVAGRYSPRGLRGAAWVGLCSATLNLLILGSLLARPRSGQLVPGAWLWVPGWFGLSVLLCVIGALAGGRPSASRRGRDINWVAGLAWNTWLAALLLIMAGGLVTGFRAGMAVPDWPNTFGSNMFLYPLAQMTGGVFYEHTHRLLGTLVGAATLLLAIYLAATVRGRRAVVVLVWLVGTGIAVQGVLGGLRVTDNNHVLAVVHGFFAHAVLAGLVAVAVLLSRRWQRGKEPSCAPSASSDHFLTAVLVGAVLVQTLLGTLVRQLDYGLLFHITFAAVVVLVTLAAGMRAWGLNPRLAVLRRLGVAVMLLVLLQVNFGIVALLFRTPPVDRSPTAEMLQAEAGRLPVEPLPALLTTTHQATAAVILSTAMVLALWTWRLLDGGGGAGKGR